MCWRDIRAEVVWPECVLTLILSGIVLIVLITRAVCIVTAFNNPPSQTRQVEPFACSQFFHIALFLVVSVDTSPLEPY